MTTNTMKMKIEKLKGWTEVIIDDDCGYEKFYQVADLLEHKFNLVFTKRLDNFDSLYWDFEYLGSKLTLHYTIYLGISLFPEALKSATQTDNENASEIGVLVFEKLFELDWSDFDSGKTLGSEGSEIGTIIRDLENSNGARVTLEKDCGTIPFAITIGIYGLLLHTHYERDLKIANEYIEISKFRINQIFDLYAVPKEKQDEYWQSKLDKRISEIAEISETTITTEEKQVQNNLQKSGSSWWKNLALRFRM